ncbi:MAG: cytochrome C oxidase subunit IV family protein [Thermoanaerobaculia bacterium]
MVTPEPKHEHAPTHHVSPLSMYFGVFLALMIFTVVTVWISTINLGLLNTPVALGIAVIKATLVILFFMHVIHSTRLTWVVILGSFLWLAVLFVLTFADYLTRSWAIY